MNKNKTEENRRKLVIRILPMTRKYGLSNLKINDIANYMNVSKATMYKYFSSKDDINNYIIDLYTEYITEVNFNNFDEDKESSILFSISSKFQRIIEQSFLISFYISNTFLDDLNRNYPDLYRRITDAQNRRNEDITSFIHEQIKKGYFNDLNPSLLLLEDWILLRHLFDPKTLVILNTSLEQALIDYYLIKKHTMISSQYLSELNDDNMKNFIKKAVNKFSGYLV